MRTLMIGMLAAAAGAVAVPALAAGIEDGGVVTRAQVQARVQERFARVDANRDGAITREEVAGGRQARRGERREAAFAALDANRDSQLSKAEFMAPRREGDRAGHSDRGERGERPGMRMPGAMSGGRLARLDATAMGG